MSVLVIRAHKRFAVRRQARLGEADGLLIELSLDGCRVSTQATDTFALEQTITVAVDGSGPPLEGRIRWLGDDVPGQRTIGLRFLRPMHVAALDELVRLCRAEAAAPTLLRAYGT